MKLRTIRLLTKEGIANVYKNKLMSLASLGMVVISLLVLGLVLLFAVNIRDNFQNMIKELEVIFFLDPDIAPFDKEAINLFIETKVASGDVSSYTFETKEQAFLNIQKDIVDQSLLKGFTKESMPESFYVKLADPENSDAFIAELKMYRGILQGDISYPEETRDQMISIQNVVNAVTFVVLLIMMIISIFIISNTIRLTVFARRKEIEIMKYVGSLDGFIRLPFIVEGIIIGLVGAITAFLITYISYGWVQNGINNLLLELHLVGYKAVEFEPLAISVLSIYTIIGMTIGAIGSIISVRKHLNV
jgi:cell division transport system permease protein